MKTRTTALISIFTHRCLIRFAVTLTPALAEWVAASLGFSMGLPISAPDLAAMRLGYRANTPPNFGWNCYVLIQLLEKALLWHASRNALGGQAGEQESRVDAVKNLGN